jgi:hypothetical protein
MKSNVTVLKSSVTFSEFEYCALEPSVPVKAMNYQTKNNVWGGGGETFNLLEIIVWIMQVKYYCHVVKNVSAALYSQVFSLQRS